MSSTSRRVADKWITAHRATQNNRWWVLFKKLLDDRSQTKRATSPSFICVLIRWIFLKYLIFDFNHESPAGVNFFHEHHASHTLFLECSSAVSMEMDRKKWSKLVGNLHSNIPKKNPHSWLLGECKQSGAISTCRLKWPCTSANSFDKWQQYWYSKQRQPQQMQRNHIIFPVTVHRCRSDAYVFTLTERTIGRQSGRDDLAT